MNYKVIGWTAYDDNTIPTAPYTVGAENAVIDELRTRGYLFSGDAHQDKPRCAPVLNDGKKRIFSQRNWGDLMAKARGDFSPMAYAKYTYTIRTDEKEILPPKSTAVCLKDFSFAPLTQTISLQTEETAFKKAEKEGNYTAYAQESLRYIEAGDRVILLCNGEQTAYEVTQAEWGFDYEEKEGELTPLSLQDLLSLYHFDPSEEIRKKAEMVYERGKKIISLQLKKITDEN